MDDFITGLIGLVLIGVFMIFYLVGIRSIPFGIIVIAILGLIVIEFVEGIKQAKNQTKE